MPSTSDTGHYVPNWQRLLSTGVDIDAIDDKGRTMLLLAVLGSHVEIVQKVR